MLTLTILAQIWKLYIQTRFSGWREGFNAVHNSFKFSTFNNYCMFCVGIVTMDRTH